MSHRTTRRRFLALSAATTGACAVGLPALVHSRSPNEKLNIGIIGVNGRGMANFRPVAGENIVMLCDVNEANLDPKIALPKIDPKKKKADAKPAAAPVDVVAEKMAKAQKYTDWRKALDQKGVDAIVCSTTEHTHAPICVRAMREGKHVYCEKPLAHSVAEARLMGETARQKKVATQMGTQIHATDNYRRVVELVQAGAVGPIREVHVWCDRTPIGMRERPTGTQPVPQGFHWDLWLGPASDRPYHSEYHLGGCLGWDKRWDFGNGTLGDMGSHEIDLPFWALDLRHPLTVEAEGDPRDDETYPKWLKAKWEHPAKGNRPAVVVNWYDGGQRPETPPEIDLTSWKIGCIFKGDAGWLVADYGRRILLPKEKFAKYEAPKPTIPPSLGHHEEWLHACKTGAPTLCNFDYSGALVEHNLLGCVAFRAGKKLQWDAAALKATNCPEAQRYIHKTYRKGWELV